MKANQIKATEIILNVLNKNHYVGPIYDQDNDKHVGNFYIMYDSDKMAYMVVYTSSENKLEVYELGKWRIICQVTKDIEAKSYSADINVLNLRLSDLISTYKLLEREWVNSYVVI